MTKPLAAGGGAAIPQTLTAVAVAVPREFTEALADFLAEAGVIASAWEDWEGGPSRVEIFLETPEGVPDAELALKRAGAAYGLALQPVVSTLQSEDWTETWKRFFHTAQISPRLVVRPPWESYAPRADEQVIILDPGMSFGTGRHGTTQACMQMLDELALGDRSRGVLDIGCGSGILSIAAAKLATWRRTPRKTTSSWPMCSPSCFANTRRRWRPRSTTSPATRCCSPASWTASIRRSWNATPGRASGSRRAS
jgi:hypothetical protein